MQAGYFKTAWGDIKASPGWKSKLLLLALILLGSSFVPVIGVIFGYVLVFGYLYGWARDAAWGIQSPLPQRIFNNSDGKLYSRGFFITVLSLVLGLIPGVFFVIYWMFYAAGMVDLYSAMSYPGDIGLILTEFLGAGFGGIIFYLLYIAAMYAVKFFVWVGSMRISIYGRLSAGFQIKKIWAMLRHNKGGIFRIFGMNLLLQAISGLIFMFIAILLLALAVVIAVSMGVDFFDTGSSPSYYIGALFVFLGFSALFLSLPLSSMCG